MDKDPVANPEVANVDAGLTWKNVRKAQEIETLFRFIDEHGLRRETKMIFEVLWSKLGTKKRTRRSSAKKVH